MQQSVSSTKRTVTYEMTPEEADETLTWAREHLGELPSVVKHFMEPLFAVADKREYGGH